MPDIICGTCRFFQGAKKLPEGVAVPPAYDTSGQCQRYPTPLRKWPDGYWCGEWGDRDEEDLPK